MEGVATTWVELDWYLCGLVWYGMLWWVWWVVLVWLTLTEALHHAKWVADNQYYFGRFFGYGMLWWVWWVVLVWSQVLKGAWMPCGKPSIRFWTIRCKASAPDRAARRTLVQTKKHLAPTVSHLRDAPLNLSSICRSPFHPNSDEQTRVSRFLWRFILRWRVLCSGGARARPRPPSASKI
jgi:hypothetical protein